MSLYGLLMPMSAGIAIVALAWVVLGIDPTTLWLLLHG